MTPEQYEHCVAEIFRMNGYESEVTPYSGDGGIDVIARKDDEIIGIQCKMYGKTRKVNKETICALYGAYTLQGCSKAAIVTDGELLNDAKSATIKLGIDVYIIPKEECVELTKSKDLKMEAVFENRKTPISFGEMWEKYIMPLKGKTLNLPSTGTNTILEVDWGGIKRVTSNGNEGKIIIEPFRWAYNRLSEKGAVFRADINTAFPQRCSSGVALILSQVPFIEQCKVENKACLRIKI